MGFVGGKQSCIELLQANVFYRGYLIYTYTHTHLRVSKLLLLPQWCPHRDCIPYMYIHSFSARRALSINFTSLVYCDLFPKPRTANEHALRVTYRVHSVRELSVAWMVHLRCISLHGSREYPENLARFERNVIV